MTEAELPSPKALASVLHNMPIGTIITLEKSTDDRIKVSVCVVERQNWCCQDEFSLRELDLGPIMIGFIDRVIKEYIAEKAKRQ